VEDFEPWRRFISLMVEQEPQLRIICEVSDGLEAVLKAKELQPDLILLDIGLPRLNGIDAARQIHRSSPKSKILFLSQESSRILLTRDNIAKQCRQTGAAMLPTNFE